MKGQLGGKIMTELTYSYLMDDGGSDKKSKRNKEVCYKTKT